MALLVLLLLFQGKFFRLFQVLNSMLFSATAKLERASRRMSILQVEVEGGKMGIQSALLLFSSLSLLFDAVNCKSPLMRLLHYGPGPFPLFLFFSSLKYTFIFRNHLWQIWEKASQAFNGWLWFHGKTCRGWRRTTNAHFWCHTSADHWCGEYTSKFLIIKVTG